MNNNLINTVLYSMINKDEKILWRGKPDRKCYIYEAIFNPMFFVALVWGLIDFTFLATIIAGTISSDAQQSLFFVIPFFLIHLMPVWIYLGGVFFAHRAYVNTEYIITDKAVYCSGGVFSQNFETKPFFELSHVDIHRGIFDQYFGVGDVIITCNHDGYNTNDSHSSAKGINICNIREFQKVYNMIKELNKDNYTDAMFPNDLRPSTNHGYKTQYINDKFNQG